MADHRCLHCGAEVYRAGARGRWPKLCPSCRSDPAVLQQLRRARGDERRRLAEERVTRLMDALDAGRQEEPP